MPVKKITVALLIATVITIYFVGDGDRFLSIDMFQNLFEHAPITTAAVFFTVFFIGSESATIYGANS